MQWRLRKRISNGRRAHCRNNVGLSRSGIIRSHDKEDLTRSGILHESRANRVFPTYTYTGVRKKGKSVLHLDCMSTENNAAPSVWRYKERDEKLSEPWRIASPTKTHSLKPLPAHSSACIQYGIFVRGYAIPRVHRRPSSNLSAESPPYWRSSLSDWLRRTKSLLIPLADLRRVSQESQFARRNVLEIVSCVNRIPLLPQE